MFFKNEIKTKFRSCASITAEVNEMVASSGVQEGLCLISVPHTTAGLVITSFWDPRGLDDLLDEIDGVLESNAEEFVRGFIQKGGQ